jgi:hypothetical protein
MKPRLSGGRLPLRRLDRCPATSTSIGYPALTVLTRRRPKAHVKEVRRRWGAHTAGFSLPACTHALDPMMSAARLARLTPEPTADWKNCRFLRSYMAICTGLHSSSSFAWTTARSSASRINRAGRRRLARCDLWLGWVMAEAPRIERY